MDTDVVGKTIRKNLIWNDIRCIEHLMDAAWSMGLQDHPFYTYMVEIRRRWERDLIDETRDA